MKLVLVLLFTLPSLTFACPDFSGVYKCSNVSANERIDSMSFQAKQNGFEVISERFGWHIVGADGTPFSGEPVIGPFSTTSEIILGNRTVTLGETTIVYNVFCNGNVLISQAELHTPELGPNPFNSEEQFTWENESKMTYNSLNWGTVTCIKTN